MREVYSREGLENKVRDFTDPEEAGKVKADLK